MRAFKANLIHEGVVYQHLSELQGELIPVYLGNISLACPYFLDVGVRIMHMLLMSWAGEQAQKDFIASIGLDMDLETTCAVTKLRCHSLDHCDVRPPNVLWNSEMRRIMLVDFEQSDILTCASALQELSLNLKLERLHFDIAGLHSTGTSFTISDSAGKVGSSPSEGISMEQGPYSNSVQE